MAEVDEHDLLEQQLEKKPEEKPPADDEGDRRSKRREEKSSRRDRDRDDDDRDRRRDRDSGRRHRRSRSRSRDRRSRRDRSRSRSRDRRDTRGPPGGRGGRDGGRGPRRDERKEEEFVPPEVAEARRRQKELEELDRDTRTVFAYNVNTKADEKEIFDFFTTAGTVVDVRIIMDRNSRRSKGFAYVEMESRDSIPAALALTGQMIMGQVVMVKSSEAEKNMAWEASQQAQQANMMAMQPGMQAMGMGGMFDGGLGGGSCKLNISGLNPMVTEEDLKAVFEPFGLTDYLVLNKDAAGQSVGSGAVQYKTTADATRAIAQLNGLNLAGQSMVVAIAPLEMVPSAQGTLMVNELDEEGGDGMKLNAQSRAALMARLAGQEPPKPVQPFGGNVGALPGAPQAAVDPGVSNGLNFVQGILGPASPIATQCLLLKNMFNPAEETEPEWHLEIAEDVKEECSKFGEVRHIHVDKDSAGFVYLKFVAVQGCEAAKQSLHGRWFAGKMVTAEFQFTREYDNHFPEARA